MAVLLVEQRAFMPLAWFLYMRLATVTFALTLLVIPVSCGDVETQVSAPPRVDGQRPIYDEYARILHDYVLPGRGVRYEALKENELETLRNLREKLGEVDLDSLTPDERLAYWINVYNLNVLGIVTEHYPVDSIRDISTDPVRRLNVFEEPLVPAQGKLISLDEVEHEIIRAQFDEPRIHFAINCAAESCPPIRPEPFLGSELDRQLAEQTRRFLSGPAGVELEERGETLVVHTTRIMDWFREDFEEAGGLLDFIMRYAGDDVRNRLALADDVEIEFDDYSWALNDASER